MKTLYVTDLDGTLLNTDRKVSEYSRSMINDLIQKGMAFTYATARSLSSSSRVTRGLELNAPVVVYNGAFVIDPKTGKILSSNVFSSEDSDAIKDLLTQHNFYPLVYAYVEGVEKVSWVTSKENEGVKHYIGNSKGDKRLNPISDSVNLYDGDVFYVICIGSKEELLPLYSHLKDNPRYNCTLQQELYREEYWCEIMHKEATKANGIQQLKVLLSCDRLVSFGDAVNDTSMFSISDECYAVENATVELKLIATGVIESNDEDAVAKFLQASFKNI